MNNSCDDIYLLGRPLETSNNGILNFVQVLHSLGAINENVGASAVGAEAPDLTGLSDVVLVLVAEVAATHLEVVTGVDLTLVNILSQTIGHGHRLHEQTIVLVGRLGQTHNARLLGYCLAVRHNGVGFLDGNASVVLFQILQANFQMQLTSASNDVLTRLFNQALHHRIGLGQTLQT
jgi:hypothetical protein